MKNLIIILLSLLISTKMFAQTVTLTGTTTVEVGIKYYYSAEVLNLPVGDTIMKYSFDVSKNGLNQAGPSLIFGKNSEKIISSHDTKENFDVIWGDFNEGCSVNDEIKVDVEIKHAYYETVDGKKVLKFKTVHNYANLPITINWLETPIITPSSSVQKCCSNTIDYCSVACKGDEFIWSVTGGTFPSSQQGSKCIEVTPSTEDNIVITVKAKRKTGLNNYFRNQSITISRTIPQTPPIQGIDILCQGDTTLHCVGSICGMTGVNWTIPNTVSIVSGQGTNCIKITPVSSAPDGTSVVAKATAIMKGGCSANSASTSMKIYSSGEAPIPEGEVEIVFNDNYDPCNDENSYEIVYHPNNPYINGITVVKPPIVIDVPHHRVGDRINIKVCNINLCSLDSSCVSWTLFLPPPCKHEEKNYMILPKIIRSNSDAFQEQLIIRNTSVSDIDSDLKIYPNPFNKSVNFEFPLVNFAKIEIFDIKGSKIYSKELFNTDNHTFTIEDNYTSGLFFVSFISDKSYFIEKLIFQEY